MLGPRPRGQSPAPTGENSPSPVFVPLNLGRLTLKFDRPEREGGGLLVESLGKASDRGLPRRRIACSRWPWPLLDPVRAGRRGSAAAGRPAAGSPTSPRSPGSTAVDATAPWSSVVNVPWPMVQVRCHQTSSLITMRSRRTAGRFFKGQLVGSVIQNVRYALSQRAVPGPTLLGPTDPGGCHRPAGAARPSRGLVGRPR